MSADENKPEQEVTYLEDISGTPAFYRMMVQINEIMRVALESNPEKFAVDSASGQSVPIEKIHALLKIAQERVLQDDPLLGKSPSAMVGNLLSELEERVREAYELPEVIAKRDVAEAIRKRRPLEPSVFERAWLLELFAILDGLKWMFSIARLAHRGEAQATGTDPSPLPPSFREGEMRDLMKEFRGARNMLAAHYFGRLQEGLTVKAYFDAWIRQEKLILAHGSIEGSIQGLRKWHDENRALIEKHIAAEDLIVEQRTRGSRRRRS